MRPRLFEEAFIKWVDSLRADNITKEVISLDGKCIKGSKDSFREKNPIYMVSAWASQNQLVLGQLKVNEKSNEITAIPLLLDLLDIEGSIIKLMLSAPRQELQKKS